LLFSLFTMLGAPAAAVSFTLFGVTRLLLGLSEGVHFPMMTTLTKNWFPANERARANSLWISGILVAQLAAPFLPVPLLARGGWRSVLVITGTLGRLTWWPSVWFSVHNSPESSPRISDAERAWLRRHADSEATDEGTGDRRYLRDANFYIALAGAVLNN